MKKVPEVSEAFIKKWEEYRWRAFGRWMQHRPHPYLAWKGPIAYAHRGGADNYPESTLLAFSNTIQLGYAYIELDVHLSKDGILMVCHDSYIDRITDKTGSIASLTAADLEKADAGYRFTKNNGLTFPHRGQGLRIPRLEDVLQRFPNTRFNIDPKSDAAVVPLYQMLKKLNALDRVGIASASDRRIEQIRMLGNGQVCTAMTPREVILAYAASRRGAIPPQGAHYIQLPAYQRGSHELVDKKFIDAAHKSQLRVHVWTINDEARMNHLLDMGVDGIMTDKPDLLKKVLMARGLWISGQQNIRTNNTWPIPWRWRHQDRGIDI